MARKRIKKAVKVVRGQKPQYTVNERLVRQYQKLGMTYESAQRKIKQIELKSNMNAIQHGIKLNVI